MFYSRSLPGLHDEKAFNHPLRDERSSNIGNEVPMDDGVVSSLISFGPMISAVDGAKEIT